MSFWNRNFFVGHDVMMAAMERGDHRVGVGQAGSWRRKKTKDPKRQLKGGHSEEL
jgi:hypothetical protein